MSQVGSSRGGRGGEGRRRRCGRDGLTGGSEGVRAGTLVVADCLSTNTVGDVIIRLYGSIVVFIECMSDLL